MNRLMHCMNPKIALSRFRAVTWKIFDNRIHSLAHDKIFWKSHRTSGSHRNRLQWPAVHFVLDVSGARSQIFKSHQKSKKIVLPRIFSLSPIIIWKKHFPDPLHSFKILVTFDSWKSVKILSPETGNFQRRYHKKPFWGQSPRRSDFRLMVMLTFDFWPVQKSRECHSMTYSVWKQV